MCHSLLGIYDEAKGNLITQLVKRFQTFDSNAVSKYLNILKLMSIAVDTLNMERMLPFRMSSNNGTTYDIS